jgi:phosphoglycerate dehydrogenase-like enzyme
MGESVTNKPLVLCIEKVPAAVRELILGLKPEELGLVFVETSSEEERVEKVRDADYILCSPTPVSARVIEAGRRLKLIQKYGIGVDKIDLVAAARRGIPVCITAGANAVAVAEIAITLMLAVYKRLCVAHNSVRAGQWLKWELRSECYELAGKTVGIVGGGAIGRAVAKRLSLGFECNVLYYDVYRMPEETEKALGMTYAPLNDLLREADIVSLHTPLTRETRGLIGRGEFASMKCTAVLINTSRGEVVDEQALIEALQGGIIASAGLDVYAVEPPDPANPLLKMDNVVLSPHNGGGTVDTVKRVIDHSFDNIMRVERGEPLPERDLIKVR